jgi:hypothetical protein
MNVPPNVGIEEIELAFDERNFVQQTLTALNFQENLASSSSNSQVLWFLF